MSHLPRTILLLAAQVAASVLLSAQSDSLAGRLRIQVTGGAPDLAPDLQAELIRRGFYDGDSIVAVVRSWYAERGYLHADNSLEVSGDDLIVRVSEGPPATVTAVRIDGLSTNEIRTLQETLVLKPGTRFTPASLDRDIAVILSHAERTGRPLTSVTVAGLDDADDSSGCRVVVALLVTPGPTLTIGAVNAIGNIATSSATIRRASGLRIGAPWTLDASISAIRRLQRTGLFTTVGEPVVELNERQQVAVALPVTEGRHSAFDGMIGYLPAASGGGGGTITGLVDIRLGNLLGTARKLSLRWFQERQGTHEIDVGYREPWVLNTEIDADLDLHQRKQDSSFVRQQFGISASGRVDESITVGGSYIQASTTPVDGYGRTVMSASDQRLFGLRLAYDTRDNTVTPRSGVMYAADLHTGRKRSSGPGGTVRASLQRMRADLAVTLSPFQAQTFNVEAHGVDVRGGTLDVADLVRLGGATSLRGYREGEFVGSRLAWGTLEHRFFFTPRSFIGLFVDAGSIRRPSLSALGLSASEFFRFGYGLTLRVDAPVGLLGVSIALGKGDGFGDAKLHVRVQSEF